MKKFLVVLIAALSAHIASAQTYTIEPTGIGPVKVGMNYKKLPKSVPGLYDRIEACEMYDEMEDETSYFIQFFQNDTQTMYAHGDESGNIYRVYGDVKSLRTQSGAYPKMLARDFIVLPGVVTLFKPKADELYQVTFEIDGVPVNIERYHYTPAGERKIKNALRTRVKPKFVPADFVPEAWIFLGGY